VQHVVEHLDFKGELLTKRVIGKLADALAEHLGINEKAKLLFQKVMTSDNLSYLLDKEFLWEGIKPIHDVSQDDNLKDKGSTSGYAE
jgi:hypothetical protein